MVDKKPFINAIRIVKGKPPISNTHAEGGMDYATFNRYILILLKCLPPEEQYIVMEVAFPDAR